MTRAAVQRSSCAYFEAIPIWYLNSPTIARNYSVQLNWKKYSSISAGNSGGRHNNHETISQYHIPETEPRNALDLQIKQQAIDMTGKAFRKSRKNSANAI